MKPRIKCECGHWRTSHYDYVALGRYGCHAVKPDGSTAACECIMSQGDVFREWLRRKPEHGGVRE